MITIKATEEVTYRCEIMDEMEEEILDYIRENQDSMQELTDEEKIFTAIRKLKIRGCRMLTVKNTPENRAVQQAVATLSLEGMYLDEGFVRELLKVANKEKTSEELRREVVQKYT